MSSRGNPIVEDVARLKWMLCFRAFSGKFHVYGFRSWKDLTWIHQLDIFSSLALWWLSQMSPIVAQHCSLNLSLEINSQFATFFQSLRRCVSFDSRQCTCSRQRSVETKKIETTSFCIEEDPLALDFGIWLSEVFEEFFSFPTWAGAIHTTFLHYSPCNCNAFVCRVPQTQDLGLFSLAY